MHYMCSVWCISYYIIVKEADDTSLSGRSEESEDANYIDGKTYPLYLSGSTQNEIAFILIIL